MPHLAHADGSERFQQALHDAENQPSVEQQRNKLRKQKLDHAKGRTAPLRDYVVRHQLVASYLVLIAVCLRIGHRGLRASSDRRPIPT